MRRTCFLKTNSLYWTESPRNFLTLLHMYSRFSFFFSTESPLHFREFEVMAVEDLKTTKFLHEYVFRFSHTFGPELEKIYLHWHYKIFLYFRRFRVSGEEELNTTKHLAEHFVLVSHLVGSEL